MDDKPFFVRVVTVDEKEKGTKKTLVMTHAYAGCSPAHMKILKGLSELYHLVLFDNISWGLNTRDGDDTSCKNGPEAAEQFNIDFMERTISALDEHLPEKFLLCGHSFGGYLASLFASRNSERVEALCLISPVASSYIPEQYDPYSY